MGDAKRVHIAPVSSADAARVVKRYHYSGRVVKNSQVHLGAFLDGALLGVMSFGPPMDRKRLLPLVAGSEWENVVELNRMAFSDRLPRCSESRALAIACRMLQKHAPRVKWVVTFADGVQCGDGTIYRAAGFLLTSVKDSDQIWEMPDGARYTRKVLTDMAPGNAPVVAKKYGLRLNGGASLRPFIEAGARLIPGFMFRYLRFLDPAWRLRLTVPVIPYEKIPAEARMYLGRRPVEGPDDQSGKGGSDPTPTLQGAPR